MESMRNMEDDCGGWDCLEMARTFRPVAALSFVCTVAILPWVEDDDVLCAVRVVSQIQAFRRSVLIGQENRSILSACPPLGTMHPLDHTLLEEKRQEACDYGVRGLNTPKEETWRSVERCIVDLDPQIKGQANAEVHEMNFKLGSKVSPKLQYPLNSPPKPQNKGKAFCEELVNLHSLALDPFFGGDEALRALKKNILKFRSLSYKKEKPPSKQLTSRKGTRVHVSHLIALTKSPVKLVERKRRFDCDFPFKLCKNVPSLSFPQIYISSEVQKESTNKEESKKIGQDVSKDFKEVDASDSLNKPRATKNSRKEGDLSNPKSLHMKFPRDFRLPSKDELIKKFAPFGLVDFSRSKVFFYTGSARVVFLNELDAMAAYHYLKRKKVLFGGANVRFWLDPYEHIRNENYVSASCAVAAMPPSTRFLKSCLKKPTRLGKRIAGKFQVKFS